MFGMKNDKKGHPGIAFALGALSVTFACYIKNCGMNAVKNKMQNFGTAFKEGGCAMKNAISSCQTSSSDMTAID